MEIKKKNNRKKIISAIVIVLILAAGVGAYYYFTHKSSSQATHSATSLAPATDQEKAAGNQAKSSNADATKSTTSPSPSPSSASGITTVSVNTTANAQNGSIYQLRYLINAVVSNAMCTLTLTQGSSTVTKTASTQALAQSSTCVGFDIPTSSLGSGSWQATMVVSGGNVAGSVTNTIQVH